jgi:hypothetical protein
VVRLSNRLAAGVLPIVLAVLLAGPATAAGFEKIGEMTAPGNPIKSFDLTALDPATQTYYFTDRSNKGVDLFDARTRRFVTRISGFSGPTNSLDTAGPNGLVVVTPHHQLWAGNGDSSVKIIDLSAKPPVVVGSVSTGGAKRADSVAYDPADDMIVAVNDADDTPFVTFIAASGEHRILGKIPFPDATNGLEAPIYVAQTGLIYMSVPQIGPDKAKGGVAVIDPKALKVLRMIPLSECQPAGIVQGPGSDALVGCSQDAVEAGFKPKTIIIDVGSEKEVASIPQIGGSDEVAYMPSTRMYFLGARGMPGGAKLGVIDAATRSWVENVPTAKNSHSVAADPVSRIVFVPEVPNEGCKTGCIALFAQQGQ